MTEKYKCIVCGRKFPKGQGIVLVVGGKEYPFHSKTCAVKFFRRLIEEIDQHIIVDAFERVRKAFEEELREKASRTAKRIV